MTRSADFLREVPFSWREDILTLRDFVERARLDGRDLSSLRMAAAPIGSCGSLNAAVIETDPPLIFSEEEFNLLAHAVPHLLPATSA